MFSLDIHATLFKKKWRMAGFEVEKGELGESRRSFQTEKNGGKTFGEASETTFYPFSAGKLLETENSRKFRCLRRMAETKQPANG